VTDELVKKAREHAETERKQERAAWLERLRANTEASRAALDRAAESGRFVVDNFTADMMRALDVVEAADRLAAELETKLTSHVTCLRDPKGACEPCKALAEYRKARQG
jgi:hypothetical protein